MKDQVRIEGSLKKQQKDVQIITTKHKPANHYLSQLFKKLHLGDQCNSAETPPIYNLGHFFQQGWFLQYKVTNIPTSVISICMLTTRSQQCIDPIYVKAPSQCIEWLCSFVAVGADYSEQSVQSKHFNTT